MSCLVSGKYYRADLNFPSSLPRRKDSTKQFENDPPLSCCGIFQSRLIGKLDIIPCKCKGLGSRLSSSAKAHAGFAAEKFPTSTHCGHNSLCATAARSEILKQGTQLVIFLWDPLCQFLAEKVERKKPEHYLCPAACLQGMNVLCSCPWVDMRSEGAGQRKQLHGQQSGHLAAGGWLWARLTQFTHQMKLVVLPEQGARLWQCWSPANACLWWLRYMETAKCLTAVCRFGVNLL